jgi:ATPase subunit of ABC transporter with duplicated ATPase domains
MDAGSAEGRARTVLLGLGFKPDMIDGSVLKLSGGWRTRCELACALCQQCDVLLLDEPTNFLDLPSIIWLQDYIADAPALEKTTVVVVSHDRDFSDALSSELLLMRDKKIERFRGTLSLYESEKLKKIAHLTTMKDAVDKQRKHMEQSVQNNIRAAKRTGDDKKLKQAASRQKRIDDRTGLTVSAKGGRWKLNRDAGAYGLSKRSQVEIPDFEPPPRIAFPLEPADLRFPGALVSLEHVSVTWSSSPRTAPPTLSDVSLTIHPGQRLGLCGLNGSGKSTLVHAIAGTSGVRVAGGAVARHPRLQIARFSQHAVDELGDLGRADASLTALAHLRAATAHVDGGGLSEQDARGVLGSLGLAGAPAASTPLGALSGGQRVRLALALCLWRAPHLLVLDEATTHLDADSIAAFALALRGFKGAVIVVTHDRFFMRCVVEGASPAVVSGRTALEKMEKMGLELPESDGEGEGEEGVGRGTVYRVFRGGLRKLEGGMDEYEDIAARLAAKMVDKGLAK